MQKLSALADAISAHTHNLWLQDYLDLWKRPVRTGKSWAGFWIQSGEISQTGRQKILDRWRDETECELSKEC